LIYKVGYIEKIPSQHNMQNLKNYGAFKSEICPEVNESFWSSIFGKPSVSGAARDSFRGRGYSHTGKDENNYIMFDGQKFYPDQIEYDDYNSTKEIPRVEDGKLIVANPVWSM
jgi:hypothetical protein